MKIFTAVVHQEDDIWVALCPEVGTTSQGRDLEATGLYLEELPGRDVSRSLATTFELPDV